MFNNIFNIKPSNRFLPTLANWALEQFDKENDLASLTILLPSRRTVRELKKEFLKLSKNEALILPKILAIGDVDYDETLNENIDYNNGLEGRTPTGVDYKIELINAIKDWNHKTNLFGKNISTAALWGIAESLQNFLEEVEKEGIDLEKLKEIDDSDLASHKQKILEFLQHFSFIWRNAMLKKGIISNAARQNLMIENYDNFLKKHGSSHPIIAAGSTGSVKATRNLLKTISKLPNGKIILFGLDQKLDEKIWNKIDELHPQFALKKLLEDLKIKRSQIAGIGNNQDSLIEDLCRLVMLPAEFSDEWRKEECIQYIRAEHKNYLIEAKNEFEEARIIALLLRETLETPQKTVALISNNKILINLVKDNLSKWQIKIDDSKSSNLAESTPANYLFLISDFAANEFNVVKLLGILKHPISNIDADLLDILESKILRNVAKFSSFEDLILKSKEHPKLEKFLIKTSPIFEKLIKEFGSEKIDFKKAFETHFECFTNLSSIIIPDQVRNDTELSEFLQEIKNTKTNFELEPQSYNQILQSFLQNYQYRKNHSFHPRLHILSTMEARLINHDLTIVSGLTHGEFPNKSSDHFLGFKMRQDLGLSSDNKRIGIAAYDFCNYLQGGNIVLLAPKNQDNTPTVKSKFILKLETILKINNLTNLFANGSEYLELLSKQQLDKTKNPQKNSAFSKDNLKNFSATDISKWLRNPYFIYAKRILKLKPLKKIEAPASVAEFGNFVHKVLEEFIKDYPKINLIDHGQKLFPLYFPDPASHLIWWPRFENIAKWFLKEEEKLRENLSESFVEVEAQINIRDVLLTTKIDRVNLYKDGRVEIIDYKTGTLPSNKEIKSGLEPQLAIEALILRNGEIKNYPNLKNKKIADLQYQNLKGRDKNKIENLNNIDDLINAADDGISRLIKLFNEDKIGYIIAPDLDIYKEDDYWHLMRL